MGRQLRDFVFGRIGHASRALQKCRCGGGISVPSAGGPQRARESDPARKKISKVSRVGCGWVPRFQKSAISGEKLLIMRKHGTKSPESGTNLGRRTFVGTMAATSFGLTSAAAQPADAGQDDGAGQHPKPATASSVQRSSAAASGGRGMVLEAKVDS